MNQYEVPVWFTISAKHQNEAWLRIARILAKLETYDQLPEYVVESPVEMKTPLYDYNPVGTGRT